MSDGPSDESVSVGYDASEQEYPLDICPACYAQRDAVTPVMSFELLVHPGGSGRCTTSLRLAGTGERLRTAAPTDSVVVLMCPLCRWSERRDR